MKKAYVKPVLTNVCRRTAASGACGLNTVCGQQVQCFN